MSATIVSVWAEAHPLNRWRYDYPERGMGWWEMPAYSVLSVVRRVILRYVIIWHLLTTPPNSADEAPWDAGGWRRVKTIVALLLPIPAVWSYPEWGQRHVADSVLIWWSSGITSTMNGLSWRAYYVGVGYGRCWHPFIWEDGE